MAAGVVLPLFAALFGAIIGSFLATVLIRWPQGRSVTKGRSACDHCHVPLSPAALVPIFSHIVLRGRCRACGGAIAPLHIEVELASAAIGGLALWIAPGWSGAALALLGWQLLVLAWFDARHLWLPHRLSLILAVSGVALGGLALAPFGLAPALLDRLIGGIAGYGVLAIVAIAYRRLRGREGLGGGDAPMLGAIGAWLGWSALPFILLLAALAGLAIAALRIVAGRNEAEADWRTIRLPLGTLMALAVLPAILLLRALVGA